MLEIREANLEDADEIVKLWLEFMKEHERIVTNENPKLRPYEKKDSKMADSCREFLVSKIESTDGKVFAAEDNGKTVGYALAFIKDEIPIFRNKKIGFISDLFVKKESRKKGIGAKLMKKSMEWFRQKGMKFASLTMYPDNRLAHYFYAKLGFSDYKVEMRKKI